MIDGFLAALFLQADFKSVSLAVTVGVYTFQESPSDIITCMICIDQV